MIYKIILTSLLSLIFTSTSLAFSTREQDSEKAKQALLNLNFFYAGRGMLAPPNFPPFTLDGILGNVTTEVLSKYLRRNYGLLVKDGDIIGASQQKYNGVTATVIGCAACHVGKAAGIIIPGLGNKNIDVYALGNTFKKYFNSIEDAEKIFGKGDKATRKLMLANFKTFMTNLSDKNVHNSTQGMVPTGIIRKWFYNNAGISMDTTDPGQVKVPFFWGYAEKRKVGAFADGFGNGQLGGWAIAVELVAGQTPENVQHFIPKIEAAEVDLGKILPPKYPFEINKTLADKGEGAYLKNCSSCHGTYQRDENNLPIFEPPKWIPIQIVQTDSGRLQGLSTLFTNLVDSNPLKNIIQRTELGGRGYFAPRLVAIWARFPYLHNGSVPTVDDLMLPPQERPAIFSLKDAGEKSRFDSHRLGLLEDARYSDERLRELADSGKRWVYDTSRDELGNSGHYFSNFSELTAEDRSSIIEYLKTL